MQFSNRDLMVNAVLWLTDAEGLIGLREKSVVLRLINDKRAHDERATVQTVSVIAPLTILALVGGIVYIIRTILLLLTIRGAKLRLTAATFQVRR